MRVEPEDNSYIILFHDRVGDLLCIIILTVIILEELLIPLIAVFFEEHFANHVFHPVLVIMPGPGLLSAWLSTEKRKVGDV